MQGRIDVYKFLVMAFGIRSIPSMAGFCMKYTAEKNYPRVAQWIADLLTDSLYMDDLYASVDTVEDGQELVRDFGRLTLSTGFPMAKWNSTHPDIMKNVPEEDRAPSSFSIDDDKECPTPHKALGVTFDFKEDVFSMGRLMEVDEVSQSLPLTLRKALRTLNSCFDPVGWWCPCLIGLKRCVQEIMIQASTWDEEVPPNLEKKWIVSYKQLVALQTSEMKIPRQYNCFPASCYRELHLFADASLFAFGACVYLRATHAHRYHVSLVSGKSRIFHQSKVDKYSIARKELVALTTGVQLLELVKKSFKQKISRIFLWSDSTTVIKWCKFLDKQLQMFVRNRVATIMKVSNDKPPLYVNTSENVADIASRGFSKNNEQEFSKWRKGPTFCGNMKIVGKTVYQNTLHLRFTMM